jgi:uncharacterized membrane protein
MTLGPIQLLLVGFDDPQLHGQIRSALQDLRDNDTIRLIDAVVISKDADGEVEVVRESDLSEDEAAAFGGYVGALIGLGVDGDEGAEVGAVAGAAAAADGHVLDDQVWYAADLIGNGTAAAAALIEHRWAIGLRDAIASAGGVVLADPWVHPADLISVGLDVAAEEGRR